MRRIILCLLFSVLLVLSMGKPSDKKKDKDVKGRWYQQRPNQPGNGNGNGTVSPNERWGGGYFYARPHPGGGWWVTPARPRPNAAG